MFVCVYVCEYVCLHMYVCVSKHNLIKTFATIYTKGNTRKRHLIPEDGVKG